MVNKYHNCKTYLDGIVFDSKHEAERYAELKLMERAGVIRGLKTQVPYLLIPEQRDKSGKLLERACSYIADFVYVDAKTKEIIVEDAKGKRTDEYIIKRKLMLERRGIRIKEV